MNLRNELVVIEGYWQIGKTTLLNTLSGHGYEVVAEPIPTDKERNQHDLDLWYSAMHLKNIELAATKKGAIAIERSIVSDLAFMKTIGGGSRARGDKISQIVKNAQQSGLLQRVKEVIFLRTDPTSYMEKRAPQIKDQSVVPLLCDANSPFEAYQDNLEYFISILFPHAVIADAMSFGTNGFAKKVDILQSINRQIRGTL